MTGKNAFKPAAPLALTAKTPSSMRSGSAIKICGLSTLATIEAAVAAGAAMVGFVFFAKSPRNIRLDKAAELANIARSRAAIVGLIVDADEEGIDAVSASLAPDWLQLHGRESPERVAAIRARTGRPVMKAVGVSSRADVEAAIARYGSVADRLLFDAKPPAGAALPGGNGVAFDWTILAGLDLPIPFMLSGGLTPDTVADAIRITRAPGVDVSSGVESAPGVKDEALIAAFVAAARGG